MAIQNTTLTSTAQNLLPTSGVRAVTAVYFQNNHSGAVSVDIHVIPSGTTAANSNRIYKEVSIATGDTLIISTEKIILATGDMLQATASVDNVVFATSSYTTF
jgi:hypothetical protein|tara:strand:- start:1180 stop:1488 length:309 start_codon:yes stop_codon:yes gene_type:complete